MADMMELYYGEPGSAKTRSIIELIKSELALQPGKKVRVYIGDGSKVLYELAMSTGLIPKDSLIIADFLIRPFPFTTCQQICEGFWPEDVNNPMSKMRKLTPQEVAETIMWVFEGASVMGNYMLGDAQGGLAQRAADGEVLGQEANIKFTDSPDYKFGGNAGAHYNIAQRHLLQNIIRTKAFPGRFVIWSAHERIDDGERGGAFVKGGPDTKIRISDKSIGAELVGKALTASISREYGNTLHFTQATKKVADGTDPISGKTLYKDKAEYRVYTRDHYDPDGIVTLKYRAVNRAINPNHVQDYYVSDKPGAGLLQFYADLAKDNSPEGTK